MRPRGSAGSSTTVRAPIRSATRSMCRASPGCGSSTGSRVRSMRNRCSASHAAAPSYGVVSTAKSAGSSRRHSSQSRVWMPPILGGKSLVTSRCVIDGAPWIALDRCRRSRGHSRRHGDLGAHDRVVIVGGRRHQIVEAEPGRGPYRVGAQQRVGAGEVAGEHRTFGVVTATHVAQHDEGVASEVAGIALGDVPTPVAGHERVVGGGQHLEHRHPGIGVASRADLDPLVGPGHGAPAGRAHVLAVVAAVEPVTEGDPVARAGRRRCPAPARRDSGGRRSRRRRRWRRWDSPGRTRCRTGSRPRPDGRPRAAPHR